MAKLKGGYSSDASLAFQLWFKYICMYVMKCRLSQYEVLKLVKYYTAEHVRQDVKYYLGFTLPDEQSFQGLIDHLSLAFQSCETVSSLNKNFYDHLKETKGDLGCLHRQATYSNVQDCRLQNRLN